MVLCGLSVLSVVKYVFKMHTMFTKQLISILIEICKIKKNRIGPKTQMTKYFTYNPGLSYTADEESY